MTTDAVSQIARKLEIEDQANSLLRTYYNEAREKSKTQLCNRHDKIKNLEKKCGLTREDSLEANKLRNTLHKNQTLIHLRLSELSKPKV